jgi:hypothetical protein
MDPVTAALNLATEIVKLAQMVIESQPPELRAKIATQQWEDFQKWRDFFERLTISKKAI